MRAKKSKFHIVAFLLKLGLLFFIFGVIAVGGVFAYYAKDLPNPSSIQEIKMPESTKIYDRSGKTLLYDIHGEQKRTVVPSDEIPQFMRTATVVAEDSNFYHHFGIDLRGIARAVLTNLKRKTVLQGGSTITQQLIKNIYLSPERTLQRKVKEIILAFEIELKYSKDDILHMYLNAVPYGSNAYGVEAASQTFFQKRAKDLTIAESALLASLPKAPTVYSPFGNHPEQLKKRQEYILERMRRLGYITDTQYETAAHETLNYARQDQGIKAPHFVMYVREYLEQIYGADRLENLGLTVRTTLDWELQQEAEKIITEWSGKNEKQFLAKNAALVALDPSSGQILAMVGSRDYFDIQNDGNVNVSMRPRQPGSSFKPFAYAEAFQKGYTPDTMIFDVQTNFGVQGAEEYIPQNYDEKFRGPLTFKEALAQSRNVPSIKVLYLAGINDTLTLAHSMGITTLNEPSRYGLSLVLGGGEVTLLDETSAYGVFSQDGMYNPKTPLLSVTSKSGDVLFEFTPKPQQVLEPEVARLINSILSNNNLRAPVFGEKNYLDLSPLESAVKTGTTQEFRDAWTVGYTKDIAVGVWVGNNDNSKMRGRADGSKVAAPIWNNFMKKVYELKGPQSTKFAPPQPIQTAKPILNGALEGSLIIPIDTISHKRATPYTPKELVLEKVFYQPHSLLFFVQKDNPQGDPPANPASDPQFALWEEGVTAWIQDIKNSPEQTSTSSLLFASPPDDFDDVHTEESLPQISLLSPAEHETVRSDVPFHVLLKVQNTFPVQKVEIFFDDIILKTISPLNIQNQEYSTFLKVPQGGDAEKIHILTLRLFDTVLNKGEVSRELFFQ
ncbi:MAG: PBP1A family penicillin-binding protein [Candidatus Spechtbacteria bacterium]|nr:PBP1A family penicillin-binding protein [Candidatus Spechtbacteria bacterium]